MCRAAEAFLRILSQSLLSPIVNCALARGSSLSSSDQSIRLHDSRGLSSMPVNADWLPVPTPHDPAEDPPGSLTLWVRLLQAERLAEILLPGFTARMWRGRLLTITTLAAYVADRA